MPALGDAFVALPGQHLLKVPKAERLPGPVSGRKQLLRQLRCIDDARRIKAIVAIAALFGRVLAEVAQQ